MEASASPRPRGRWRDALEERRFLAPVLISPAVLYIGVLIGAPLGLAIYLSFTDATAGSLTGDWVGLRNYTEEWGSENFRRALRNTILFTVVSQAIVLVGAAILAHWLVKDFPGKWFLRFLILLPWAAPVSLGTIGWLWIFEPTLSVVNWTVVRLQTGPLDALGIDLIDPLDPPQWLGRPNLAMASIIAVHVWRILPFATVIFIAGLASIPAEVDDAAKIDGATGLKKLFYVTLPLQLPIALVALLFGIVFTATDITVVYILTNGGPFNQTQMLTMWAFQTGIRGSSLGAGAAISLYLLPILVFVSIGMLWFARRTEVT
ncbi:MAG: carbohydrate ABC transporter permease [Gaiellaceae bacterium]